MVEQETRTFIPTDDITALFISVNSAVIKHANASLVQPTTAAPPPTAGDPAENLKIFLAPSVRVLHVGLGSTSAVKIAAVKLAFEEFFNKHSRDVPTRVVVHPVAAASGVNEQPYGLQETVTGILCPLLL